MDKIEKKDKGMRRRGDGVVLAAILIVAGLMIFFHKQGYVDHFVYRIVISWQMLLVVLGIWSLVRKHYYNGVLLIGIGAFFLIPILTGAGAGWARSYWPLLLVVAGVLILISFIRVKDRRAHFEHRERTVSDTEDGYVYSDNTLGAYKQIVLDPVFKGAMLKNTLGSTILDLRHTSIEEGETFVDIECSLGGIEIFVPYQWNVVCDIQPVLGGCEDKRFRHPNVETETARKLVIRGRLTMGGIEIKN